ncbi:hypothetical protein BH18ACT10_BH18ACT10_08300 [soil metagenome]|nr:DUF433 domain-containing protein [Rubrobacter sp.]
MNPAEKGIVSRDPEVVSGALVFAGTRVPAKTLTDYIEAGHTLEDFLDGFPTVERRQAIAFLRLAPEAVEDFADARALR